jgi:hypothetical protein
LYTTPPGLTKAMCVRAHTVPLGCGIVAVSVARADVLRPSAADRDDSRLGRLDYNAVRPDKIVG